MLEEVFITLFEFIFYDIFDVGDTMTKVSKGIQYLVIDRGLTVRRQS